VWSFITPVVDPPPPLPAPRLITPPSGATVRPPITFSWTAVSGAAAYEIQFAKDQAFTQPLRGQMVQGTSVQIGGFPRGIALYWRVAAVAPPPPLPIGFAAEPASPAPPTSTVVPLLYALHLGHWSDVSRFTVTNLWPPPPVLTAPTLLTPPNGATGPRPITFSWTAVTGASGYQFQFAKDRAFTLPLGEQMVTGTSVQIAKFPVQYSDTGVTLYWRVAAVSPWLLGLGAAQASPSPPTMAVRIGPWSAVSRFTVTGFVPPPILTAPTLLTPANGSTVTLPLTFSWTAVTGAWGYQIQFALNSTFSPVLVGLNESGTSLQIGGSAASGASVPIGNQAGLTLYWRVRAVAAPSPVANPLPSVGPWSKVWSFTVAGTPPPTPLAAPVLTAPDKGATDVTTSPLLQWDAVTGAAGYAVEVASDKAFTHKVFVGQTTAVQKQLSGLGAGSTYYWRVRAYAKGAVSPCSEVWSFTTLSAG
jgi:hypothetical protein